MEADLEALAPFCDGFAMGVLLPDGRVDVDRVSRLVAHVPDMRHTFHRGQNIKLATIRASSQYRSLRHGC